MKKYEPVVLENEIHGTTTSNVMKTVSSKNVHIRQYWKGFGTDEIFLSGEELQAIVDHARKNGVKIK